METSEPFLSNPKSDLAASARIRANLITAGRRWQVGARAEAIGSEFPAGDLTMTTEAKSLSVLVVDDNPGDQQLVATYLGKDWTFARVLALEFAADGAEALAKLRTKHFAVVVLDWHLPVGGQGEVLRYLRQNGIRIPVVVISGGERADIAADLDSLQAAFLKKDQLNGDTFWLAIAQSLQLLHARRPT